jgi:hypothetical protein
VACIADRTNYAWELSLWTYTAGSPGTLARVQLLDSSTGSAITFAGNVCDITIEIPPPALVSSGTTSAGLLAALGAAGQFDPSVITPGLLMDGKLSKFFQPTLTTMVGGMGNGFFLENGNNVSNSLSGSNNTNLLAFLWTGTFPITKVSIGVQTAGTPVSPATTCQVRLGFYALNSAGTALNLIWEPTASTPFDASKSGLLTLTAPTDFAAFTLPPGVYLQGLMSADATSPTPVLNQYEIGNIAALDSVFGRINANSGYQGVIANPYNNTNQVTALKTSLVPSDIFSNSFSGSGANGAYKVFLGP